MSVRAMFNPSKFMHSQRAIFDRCDYIPTAASHTVSVYRTPVNNTNKPQPDIIARTLAELGPVVGTLAVMAITLPAIGGFAMLGFAGQVREAIEKQGTAGPILYSTLFALCTGFAILPTYAMSAVAGFIFGGVLGSAVSLPGIVVGSVIGYIVAAFLARSRVMDVISKNPKARIIRGALVERSPWEQLVAVTLLRLPPNSPFALTNLVMSAVHVNPINYIIGTAVGIAPRTILACVIGAGVAEAGGASCGPDEHGGEVGEAERDDNLGRGVAHEDRKSVV